MYLQNLTLEKVRGFEKAKFELGGSPGIYLLVGVNGAGKSTALDALVIILSRVLRTLGITQVRGTKFNQEDIMLGHNGLNASLSFLLEKQPVLCSIQRYWNPRKELPESERTMRKQIIVLSERPAFSINKGLMQRAARLESFAPLVVYFSPRRSVLRFAKKSERDEARDTSPEQGKRPASAYDKALTHRELNIEDFISWWENVDKAKQGQANYILQRDELNKTISSFLTEFSDLQPSKKGNATLQITKNQQKLKIEQLSDGERSVLAFILELTRRLSLANPTLSNPAQEGSAVVLIDEIDLHLHPVWQRDIIHLLSKSFPKCQFIATTHSPQSIGEVDGTHVNIIYGPNKVGLATQSFGMDSNWILDVLMKSEEKNDEVKQKESRILSLIHQRKFKPAKAAIEALKRQINGNSDAISEAENIIYQMQNVDK